jgi:HSP20 family protein
MFGLVPWTRNRNQGGALVERDDNPFALLRREFDTMFDQFFGRWPAPLAGDWTAAGWGLDVEDAGKEVVVRAEAPGFEATDFDVQVHGDRLYIRAEHKEEARGDKKEGERAAPVRYGLYERWLTLPYGTDTEKVEARYRNGVLEVHLPKTPEALGRKIEVKT